MKVKHPPPVMPVFPHRDTGVAAPRGTPPTTATAAGLAPIDERDEPGHLLRRSMAATTGMVGGPAAMGSGSRGRDTTGPGGIRSAQQGPPRDDV
ncbi:MAG: hypothetical protein ACO3JL_16220, partial [Myxococcota bacterium]